MTPEQYCKQKAAHSGSSFYYSFLVLPKTKRRAIIALYAYCREVDDIADTPGDVEVRRRKLQWWRDEIHRLYNHEAQHPITLALTPIIQHFHLPEENFLEIIDGMEMDLNNTTYHNWQELLLYCHRVAGVVGLMSAKIFGYRNATTLEYAHELGIAFQLTNIIRDIHEDARRGRIYLPLDELQRHAVEPRDVLLHRSNPQLVLVLEAMAAVAKSHYQTAFQLLPKVDRVTQRAGIIMAEIYQTLLQEIHKDGYQVMRYRISLPPLRKLWIAWRTQWRECLHG
ncbi:MAG: presqualene diphosphate synthase HpnD [Gammaproteobacteria bacterium]|nr:presqualene diphosphate synthase HpnD [Gammaproteobacteria bacterium]